VGFATLAPHRPANLTNLTDFDLNFGVVEIH
jgi:hypothetical protein